jgi:hypothetical protein
MRKKEKQPTDIRSILQPRIRNEADCGMKPPSIPQAIHHHVHLLTPQLAFDPLQCPFQTEPEIDFLRGRTGGDLAGEAGDALDGFDPLVDVSMQGIEECVVVESFGG